MNKEAVKHLNTEEYVYAKARDELVLRLRSAKQDLKSCKVIFFSRTSPEKLRYQSMQLMQTDQETDYFEAILHVEPVARYQKYYFELEDNAGNRYYLSPTGISETKPEIDYFEHLYTNPDDVISYPDWAKGAIYYQIFPERFCDGDETNNPKDTEPWGSTPTRENYMGGDLKGIYQKIPYLKKLGIEVIYLNPVFKGDFNHKYATKDYFHIDPIFGTNDDFARLVDELHKAGIRILLDGVFNHVGVHFDRFQDVVKRGKESPYFNWFLTTKTEDIQISHHDYECVGAYKYMPKLNTSNPDVRCFILEVMEYWIERYHIDGWRLDVADEVDMSVWQMAHMVLKPKYPNIFLLGETWGYGGKLVEDKKLDSVMNYMFRDAVRDYFGLEKCSGEEFCNRIGTMLGLYKKETADVLYNLIDSHDTERFLHYTGGNLNLLKLAAAFQMVCAGAPAIYYGDEVGVDGDNDPDCRKCMPWGENQNAELQEQYRQLIRLRKEHSCTRTGSCKVFMVDRENEVMAVEREDEREKLICLFHKKSGSVLVTVEDGKVEMAPYSIHVISKNRRDLQ